VKDVHAIVDRVLAGASRRGLEVSVCALREDGNLTRFAGNEIHQNISQEDVVFTVRGLSSGRLATTRFHGADASAADRALDRLASLVAVTPPIEGLVFPEGAHGLEASHVAPGTIETTLADKAARIRDVHLVARERGAQTYGAFVTGRTRLVVASSNGTRASLEATDATFEVIAAKDARSGYAQASNLDAKRVDVAGTAMEAVEKAVASRTPERVPAGEYEVVLAPYAVEPIVEQVAFYGVGGRAHVDGLSFLGGKEGRRVFAEPLTVADDGTDAARTLPLPFDADGVAKDAAVVVEQGVFRGALHDPSTARLAKAPPCAKNRSTAGLFDFFGSPPMATNLVVSPGAATDRELFRGIRRGLYVTRLWYVRMQDAPHGVSTGMTRDGTFLVVDGELGPPVGDLRYTQSLEEMLGRVTLVGRDAKLLSPTAWFSPRVRTATWAPSMRVSGMKFTS